MRIVGPDSNVRLDALAARAAEAAGGSLAGIAAGPPCVPAPLGERAGRVLVVGLPGVTAADDPLVDEVAGLNVGGILLNAANVRSPSQVAGLVAGVRSASRGPITVTVDEEPGRVTAFGDIVGPSPSARRLANEGSPADVRDLARSIGFTLARAGVDVDLAPVVDLDDGPWRGTIGDRSFSDDPTEATAYAMAFAAGLDDAGIISVAKHFPGHGLSTTDSHVGRAAVTAPLAAIRATHLRPFHDMVAAGVPVVMMNHLDYQALDPDLPASLSPKAYALLRETGFTGVAITDSVGMGAVNQRWDVAEAAVMSIAAGADGVLVTDGRMAKHMHRALLEAIAAGTLDEQRLNQAAARMTALAGGDPATFACHPYSLPILNIPSTGLGSSPTTTR